MNVLRLLEREPGKSLRQCAEALGVSRFLLTKRMEAMTKERLIVVSLNRWRLTPKGLALCQDVKPHDHNAASVADLF